MRFSRRLALTFALLPPSLTVLAAAGVVTVAQQGRAFSVGSVQLSRGQTLRFSNEDKFIHQIYVESPSFNYESDEQSPGSNVDVAFTQAGTFEVRCHIHPKMLLHVDVH